MNFWDELWDLLGITTVMESLKGKPKEQRQESTSQSNKPLKFIYRPQTLNEYIGQERAKDLVRLNLEKIRTIKPIHFLISGNKGHGKSTLANIIANELGFGITWHIGGAFSKLSLRDFLVKNQDAKLPQILFIDEIHNLEKTLAEYMYPIIEDFILPEGKNLKLRPFIFIGATTEKNVLIKKFSPLVDRCQADIVLETYTPQDIKHILKQYNDKIYQKNVTEEVYDVLAINTRYTPRIAIAFFDDCIVCEDLKRVLNAHRVIKNGLTDIDIKILTTLAESGKLIGEDTLAIMGNTTVEDYRLLIEPYLLTEGYLTRTTHGRVITEKGKKLLGEIKNE